MGEATKDSFLRMMMMQTSDDDDGGGGSSSSYHQHPHAVDDALASSASAEPSAQADGQLTHPADVAPTLGGGAAPVLMSNGDSEGYCPHHRLTYADAVMNGGQYDEEQLQQHEEGAPPQSQSQQSTQILPPQCRNNDAEVNTEEEDGDDDDDCDKRMSIVSSPPPSFATEQSVADRSTAMTPDFAKAALEERRLQGGSYSHGAAAVAGGVAPLPLAVSDPAAATALMPSSASMVAYAAAGQIPSSGCPVASAPASDAASAEAAAAARIDISEGRGFAPPFQPRHRFLSKEQLRSPEHVLDRLSYTLGRGTLVMINLSQRNLRCQDAELIRAAILANPQLGVLKLGYNYLGDVGASLIASAIYNGISNRVSDGAGGEGGGGVSMHVAAAAPSHTVGLAVMANNQDGSSKPPQPLSRHHPSLSVLDLGFNGVGDAGCTSLARLAVARNPALGTLYLSGNAVRGGGAVALAEAVAGGCGLSSLHLTANRIGAAGVKALMRAIAEFDVTVQMAQQDRENRMALEEERRKRLMDGTYSTALGNGVEGGIGSCMIDDVNDEQDDDLTKLEGFKCMEELYLGGTDMGSTGCLSVSNMLLTNLSLRVLCLSDNGLNDQDLSLFSQSISRNKRVPLEKLGFSFNRFSCMGVETLMNSIWGSTTLREIKLDNNQIRDRGAQLAAVVLTSVNLEFLDMGFNQLTIVGVKALMKSLAENGTLITLTLSGNVLDTNASKAVSYALAYNRTIRKLYVDHCSLSYAAQRHIAAGIVSNSNLVLRVMSGFPLGAIAVTLGLPAAMENWTNEQVLKFIRVMWDRHRHEQENAMTAMISPSISMTGQIAGSDKCSTDGSPNTTTTAKSAEKVGPSDPATVVAAAKSAFAALGDAGGALLTTEEPQRAISETSPIVSSDAVMLEKTPCGTVRIPPIDNSDDEASQPRKPNTPLDLCITHVSTESMCTTNGKHCPEIPMDPLTRKRNLEWLRLHFRSLNEMAQLPYVYSDLLQLYRYFYSPLDADDDGIVNDSVSQSKLGDQVVDDPEVAPSSALSPSEENNLCVSAQSSTGVEEGMVLPDSSLSSTSRRQFMPGLQRNTSFRFLQNATAANQCAGSVSNYSSVDNSCRRRPVSALDGSSQAMQPAPKRARNGKPRIDYFPRIKAKIEVLFSSNKAQALVLLRQLKFVETMMFRGNGVYCEKSARADPSEPLAADAEVILIDMI